MMGHPGLPDSLRHVAKGRPMRQMQARGTASRRAGRRHRSGRQSTPYASALRRSGLRPARTPSRTALMRWPGGGRRTAGKPGRRERAFELLARRGRSGTAASGKPRPTLPPRGRGASWDRLRGQRAGGVSGPVSAAAGALSSLRPRQRSRRDPPRWRSPPGRPASPSPSGGGPPRPTSPSGRLSRPTSRRPAPRTLWPSAPQSSRQPLPTRMPRRAPRRE